MKLGLKIYYSILLNKKDYPTPTIDPNPSNNSLLTSFTTFFENWNQPSQQLFLFQTYYE
jgi:hypothetical protein